MDGLNAGLRGGGTGFSQLVPSGDPCVGPLRVDGNVEMSIEGSVYLQKTRLKPRATKQIVLSGRMMEYATRVRWSLAKPQDSPIGIRDLARDGLDPVTEY